jgi:hypothetical protein
LKKITQKSQFLSTKDKNCMPRRPYRLCFETDKIGFIFGPQQSAVITADQMVFDVELWSNHQFRVYLIVLREAKLWSHRLAIFDNDAKARDYCYNQIQLFQTYQSSSEEQQIKLRPQLDFSPRRLNLSTDSTRLNFLCLISDQGSECFLL